MKKLNYNSIEEELEEMYQINKKLENENKQLKKSNNNLQRMCKKLLLKNYDMRKLLLKQGIDFENGFENLMKEILNEKDN